jgi:hypothetical protein
LRCAASSASSGSGGHKPSPNESAGVSLHGLVGMANTRDARSCTCPHYMDNPGRGIALSVKTHTQQATSPAASRGATEIATGLGQRGQPEPARVDVTRTQLAASCRALWRPQGRNSGPQWARFATQVVQSYSHRGNSARSALPGQGAAAEAAARSALLMPIGAHYYQGQRSPRARSPRARISCNNAILQADKPTKIPSSLPEKLYPSLRKLVRCTP